MHRGRPFGVRPLLFLLLLTLELEEVAINLLLRPHRQLAEPTQVHLEIQHPGERLEYGHGCLRILDRGRVERYLAEKTEPPHPFPLGDRQEKAVHPRDLSVLENSVAEGRD